MSLSSFLRADISIKRRFLIPTMAVFIPFFIATVSLIIYLFNSFYMNKLMDQAEFKTKIIEKNISKLSNDALWVASSMASIKDTEIAYNMQNEADGRLYLRKLTLPYFQSFKQNLNAGSVQVHYHKPPAKSFLRAWRNIGEKDGGDDLSKFRNSILEISKTQKSVSGLEVGQVGLNIRGIAPIIRNGKYYGSVEFTYAIDELKKALSAKDELKFLIDEEKTTLITEPKVVASIKQLGIYKLILSDNIPAYIDADLLSKSIASLRYKMNDDYYVVYIPMKDFNYRNIGVIVLATNIKDEKTKLLIINIVIVSIFIISLLLFVIIMNYFGSRVQRDAEALAESMRDISEGDGDLTVQLEVLSNDEIGALSKGFNKFVFKLQSIIRDIKIMAGELSMAMDEQSKATVSLSDNTQQLAEMQNIIITSSKENSSNIDEVSFNVDVLLNTIETLGNRVNELSSTIIKSSDESKGAISVANNVSSMIKEIEISLKSTTDIMIKIDSSSDEMTNIMNMINDISDKINLLSLNASIESARAGDAGRGFAVVAEEISKLADQTGASIKNIDLLIKTSNQEIKQGIDSVNNTVGIMSHIISDVAVVIRIIKQMFDEMQLQVRHKDDVEKEINTVKRMTEDINSIFDNYKITSEKITESILNIGTISNTNAATSEELSATSEEINGMSEKLNDIVSIFKV